MRRLLVPAVSTVVMLAILLALGVWQLQRRAWKNDLLARIDAAEHMPAVPMPSEPDSFAKVRLDGTLRTDRQAFYGAEVRHDVLGSYLVVPLERPGAPTVLVDLGWVPNERRTPFLLPTGAVEGFIHPAEHAGMFSGKDDPAKRLFYTLDPGVIGAALGEGDVAPFTLVAMARVPAGTFPEPALALPRPPDNHLQYAITWFSFALTLLIIFVLYARKALRP